MKATHEDLERLTGETTYTPQIPALAVSCSTKTSPSSKHQAVDKLQVWTSRVPGKLSRSLRCLGYSATGSPGVRLQEAGGRCQTYRAESGEVWPHQSQARLKNWAVISQCAFPEKWGDSFSGPPIPSPVGIRSCTNSINQYVMDKLSWFKWKWWASEDFCLCSCVNVWNWQLCGCGWTVGLLETVNYTPLWPWAAGVPVPTVALWLIYGHFSRTVKGDHDM